MSNKIFSIIFPSSGEQDKLVSFLDSVARTASEVSTIEILIALDEQDSVTEETINSLGYDLDIHFFYRPDTDNFSEDYYNWLAKRTCGKNVWAMNDDVEFITKDWDIIISEKIIKSKIPVYLVDTKDSTRGKINNDFCCFPLIAKDAIDAIGFLLYKQVRVYPADKVIYELYKQAGLIIDAQDVVLKSRYSKEQNNTRLWNIFIEDFNSGALNVRIGRELLILLKHVVKHFKNNNTLKG